MARLQQITVLSVLACAIAVLVVLWDRSVLGALAGSLCILLLYSGSLAMQFILLTIINRRYPGPRPSACRLFRAWLVETMVAARVFGWWQPFRSRAIPDQTRAMVDGQHTRGVVFVHGFICNRGVWTQWMEILQRRNVAFVAVNLEPVFGGIDCYASTVDDAIRRVTLATGKPPLLVCHSMGGLVARAWLRASGEDERVHHVITIGSPHHGTMLGNLAPKLRAIVNGEQMRRGSEWLTDLAQQEPPERARRFTCFYSTCDNIVMPASTAQLVGADNRPVPGVAHLAMALDRTVMDHTLSLL